LAGRRNIAEFRRRLVATKRSEEFDAPVGKGRWLEALSRKKSRAEISGDSYKFSKRFSIPEEKCLTPRQREIVFGPSADAIPARWKKGCPFGFNFAFLGLVVEEATNPNCAFREALIP